MGNDSPSSKTCLSCDAFEANRYRRSYCKLKRCFVWASEGCDRWRKVGTGNAEDYATGGKTGHGGYNYAPVR